MSEARSYAVATKYRASEPPPDWRERLARIPGVTITGSTARRAQFRGTPETAARVEAELGAQYWIEETAEREPADQ